MGQKGKLDKNIWKGVMDDLELLIPYYELGNKLISFNFDKKIRENIARIISKNDKVLEIGCGPGTFLMHVDAKEVHCIEPSEKMINYCTKRLYRMKKSVIIKQGFAEKLPYPNNFFDKVFCIFAFRDFIDKRQSMTESFRVLRKNGLLVIVDLANTNHITNKIYLLYLKLIGPLISRLMGFNRNLYDDFIRTIVLMQKPQDYLKIALNIGFKKAWIEYKLFKNVFILFAKK